MNKKVIGIVLVLLLVLGGGGFFIAKRGSAPTPTPTPEIFEPVEEPTVAPEEEVDIKDLKVKVLNGTAIAGLAAKAQTALEEAGFTVSGVGNADKKDYTEVVIQAKEKVPSSVLNKLKEELEKTYTVGENETLDADNEDDIVIILGTKAQPTVTAGADKKPAATTAPTAGATTTPATTITPTPTKTQ